jgi:superfamily I DNA and/or RNA helicase
LENRLCEITERYFNSRKLPKLLSTIADQANPRLINDQSRLPITRQRFVENHDYMQAIIAAVKALDESCLCIQGPPGAGKTYTAKNIIKALVNDGKRIGIMSNSHAAIMNLLLPMITELPDIKITKVGGYGAQKEFKTQFDLDEYENFEYRSNMNFTTKKPYEQFQIIGATVYAFANEVSYEAPVDYLFVDEASQVALANLLAVSGATKNIILMGDQMQLEQPIQGSHPENAGKSVLEFMLNDHAVIPDDKGIFLERTYRMHPDVFAPLSEIVYEGKLQADEPNKYQAITIPSPIRITKQNGILSIPVSHQGKTQSSEEEFVFIQQLIDELKTGSFIDKKQMERPITDNDILVVAPYNMQVNLLKDKLMGEIKIGTIDKFQGQEAPVVIISMAVSDVEDSPRGLDFIFDINRLNVAVSRAQALAIIVANNDLIKSSANSLEQMSKVGFFIKLYN